MSGYSSDRNDSLEPRSQWPDTRGKRRWRPPTDVYETGDHVVIKVEIGGMKANEFSISYDDRRLVISGCRRDRTEKTIYQNMEIPYGEFRTEVQVNWPLTQEEIVAIYEDGFLYVKLPKHSREHKIPVK